MGKHLGFFVTGTDTGIGKTFTSVALIRALVARGFVVAGMKPVASGCRRQKGVLVSSDAARLSRVANVTLDPTLVTPYAFGPPVSPHIAAQKVGVTVRVSRIATAFKKIQAQSDVTIVEGVGGWFAPINTEETVADLARTLDIPVILVVGLRLGALNHALLTAQAIAAQRLQWAGFVINIVDPSMRYLEENIDTLVGRMPVPLLGVIPAHTTLSQAARALDLSKLPL